MKIALAGCGKMGGALLRGWLEAGMVETALVIDPQGPAAAFEGNKRLTFIKSAAEDEGGMLESADILVLAVKPQIMGEVCAALKGRIAPDTLVLSIAAGRTLASFESVFGPRQPVIRAMPNTPAAIGRGISVATGNPAVSPEHRALALRLLGAAGQAEWTADESLLDAVTAVSGSGPAYVFLLIESLARAGEKAGLPRDLAMILARRTVIGSAALAEAEPGTEAAQLRRNVTSPGGTTEAALKILDSEEFHKLVERAVGEATKRSRELSR